MKCLSIVIVTIIVGVALAAPLPAQTFEFSADDIVAAIGVASDGYSTDEILIRDELRSRFVDHLSASLGRPLARDEERGAVLEMLKLRKAGKLNSFATRRGRPVNDSVAPIAEIAARVVGDRHRVSTDTLLADPTLREELQSEAELLRPGIDAYAVRKSVLGLRKKRALKPELVLQVADWDRTIETQTIEQLRDRLDGASVSTGPGVYLFRSGDGYLYVGEASNLSARLTEHLGGSDRISLAEYLAGENAAGVSVEMHIFPADSPVKRVTVRRAYESELIRSRDPKFNVRP
ncbi:GIY-YIG nuclease family protein [Rubripirellula reticaptiva]|nr:excinuclease ABC subunit C [Rubripirellula reticaptiva]